MPGVKTYNNSKEQDVFIYVFSTDGYIQGVLAVRESQNLPAISRPYLGSWIAIKLSNEVL